MPREGALRQTPGMGVRNVFDQYDQPENRVTHALMSALHTDRNLLDAFLKRNHPRRRVAIHLQTAARPNPPERMGGRAANYLEVVEARLLDEKTRRGR